MDCLYPVWKGESPIHSNDTRHRGRMRAVPAPSCMRYTAAVSNESFLAWLLIGLSSIVPMSCATLLQVRLFHLRREWGFLRILILTQTAVCMLALFGVFIVWEGMDLGSMPVGQAEAIALLILGQALFMTVAVPTLLARMLHTKLGVNLGCGAIATLMQALWLTGCALLGRS